MWSQKSIEKERAEEINLDTLKAFMFPDTVIGRKRFRELRYFLHKLDINILILNNDTQISHYYCVNLKKEAVDWK